MDEFSDQVTILDVVQSLRRQVLTLVLCGIVLLGFALLYSALQKRVYQSDAVIEIGLLSSDQIIEPAENLAARLRARHAVWDRSRAFPRLESVEVMRESGGENAAQPFVQLSFQGPDRDRLYAFAETVASSVLARHEVIQSEALGIETARVERLEGSLKDLRAQRQRILDKLSQDGRRDPFVSSVLLVEQSSLERSIQRLVNELADHRFKLSIMQESRSRLVSDLTASEDPVRPDWRRLLLLSVLAFAIFGPTLAFARDFWQRHRREILEG